MAYIGSSAAPIPVNFSAVQSQGFNGTGSQTAFTMARSVATPSAIEVLVNNVQQSPFDGSYTVLGTALTFSEAPSAGTNNVYVIYRDQPVGSLIDSTAYRKSDADALLSAKVNKAGDTMTGVHRHNAYLSIGKGPNNNDQITFNAVPDNNGNYTPVWTGDSSAGGSIIGMASGGNGGITIRSLRFGTNSATQAESAYPIRWQMTDGGLITTPYQPAFMARSGASSNTGPSGNLPFTEVQLNRGNHFNGSTGVFTAPVAGVYSFSAHILSRASGPSYLHFRVNGANFVLCEDTGGASGFRETSGTCLVSLSAGDTVLIYSPSSTYGNIYDWFAGHLIG